MIISKGLKLMKKLISLLLCSALAVSVCVPAFAADDKGDTVTVSLSNIEDIMPEPQGVSHVEQLLTVQKQYLTYCNDVLDRDTAPGQMDSKTQAQQSAQKKLELGYISQKEYNDAVQAVTDLSNSQMTQSSVRSQDLLKLRSLFELDDEDKLIVNPADYSKIDLTAKLSNVNYQKDLDDLYDKDAYEQTFKSLYDSMTQANRTYTSDSAKYQTKQADAQSMQQKFTKGYATQKQVDDINLELQTLGNTVAKDRNNLYMAYLSYDFMRDNGYPYTQSQY